MKLMSILNERDHQNEEDELSSEQLIDLKKGKTVFKALKKGSLSFKSEERGGEFLLTYEVKGPYWYWEWSAGEKVFRVEFDHIEVHTTDPNLYHDFISNNLEKGWKITTRSYLEDHVVNFYVRKKFRKFGIDVKIIDHIKLVLDEPQPINENTLSDDEKARIIKKGRTVYKAMKRSVIGSGMFGQVYYILPDEFDIKVDIHDDAFIQVGGNKMDNEVKLYHVNNNTGDVKPYRLNNEDYRALIDFIGKKFKSFNITLWYDQKYEYDEPNNDEPLNENKTKSSFKIRNERNVSQEELDKSVRKLKLIYKALKNGEITINDDDGPEKKYRYVLNDIYALTVNDLAGTRMIITPDGLVQDGLKFKLYEIQPNGEEVFIEKDKFLNRFLYTRIWNKIVVRFAKYDEKVALR